MSNHRQSMRGAQDGREDAKETGVRRKHLNRYGHVYRTSYERAFKAQLRREAEQHEEFRREGVIDELRSGGYDASL